MSLPLRVSARLERGKCRARRPVTRGWTRAPRSLSRPGRLVVALAVASPCRPDAVVARVVPVSASAAVPSSLVPGAGAGSAAARRRPAAGAGRAAGRCRPRRRASALRRAGSSGRFGCDAAGAVVLRLRHGRSLAFGGSLRASGASSPSGLGFGFGLRRPGVRGCGVSAGCGLPAGPAVGLSPPPVGLPPPAGSCCRRRRHRRGSAVPSASASPPRRHRRVSSGFRRLLGRCRSLRRRALVAVAGRADPELCPTCRRPGRAVAPRWPSTRGRVSRGSAVRAPVGRRWPGARRRRDATRTLRCRPRRSTRCRACRALGRFVATSAPPLTRPRARPERPSRPDSRRRSRRSPRRRPLRPSTAAPPISVPPATAPPRRRAAEPRRHRACGPCAGRADARGAASRPRAERRDGRSARRPGRP